MLSIIAHAIYLGLPVGIHADLHAWDKPLAKLKARVNATCAAGTGLAGAIFLYNACATIVYAPTAQLHEPSTALWAFFCFLRCNWESLKDPRPWQLHYSFVTLSFKFCF